MFRQLLVVLAVFLAAYLLLPAAGLPLAGPVAVALAAVAAVAFVRAGGESWSALGLARPARPWRVPLLALAFALAGYAVAIAATLVATKGLGWPPMQSARLAAVQGNLPALLGMLVVAWTVAAFGEELVFRGFLQGRIALLLGARRGAGILAALAQAFAFGLAHAYQGPTGILVTGCLGLLFGLLYLRTKSLWPLVFAHGLVDTVSLLALYAGALPS